MAECDTAIERTCEKTQRRHSYINAFAIDVRSLAAMRIGLGVVMLWDLGARSQFLTKYYTDAGVIPRSMVGLGSIRMASVYALAGSPRSVAALFMVHALCAVALLLGYRTWLATAACLIMSWSLTNRNPVMIGGGDALLGWLLIWSLFLPLGAACSLDRLIRHQAGLGDVVASDCVLSPASVALWLQAFLLYFGAVTGRLSYPEWGTQLSAVYYILKANYSTPLAHVVASSPMLTVAMTAGSIVLESIGPFITLIAARFPKVRTAIVLMFVSFHLMIGLTIYAGIFSAVCIAMWLAFLPGSAWRGLGAKRFASNMVDAARRIFDRIAVAGYHLGRVTTLAMPSSLKWQQSALTHVLVTLLFAYVLVVNLSSDVPPRIAARLGAIAHLPKCKQFWKVMDVAPHVDHSLRIEGEARGGQALVLLESPPRDPPILRNLLWPPQDARDIAYANGVVQSANDGRDDLAVSFCDWYRRRWDDAHPGQPIRRLQLVGLATPLPPFPFEDLGSEPMLLPTSNVVYRWDENSGKGK